MARRSIRDWIRRKGRGRKAMTSGMRDLIDTFDAHKPAVRPADDTVDESPVPEKSDRPHSETHA